MYSKQHPEFVTTTRFEWKQVLDEDMFKNISAWDYEYFHKDHLGNVRLTFTTKAEKETFTATFEDNTQATETATFKNYSRNNFDLFDHTDASTVYTYSQLLNGGNNYQVGLAKTLSVMPGDTIKVEVYAKYRNLTSTTGNLTAFASALTGAFGLNSTMVGDPGAAYDALNDYGTLIAGGYDHSEDLNAPKAYLNILLFDRNYNFVDAAYKQIGVNDIQTDPVIKAPHGYLSREKIVTEPGYAFIFLSNEHPTQVDVYFDDFKVTQVKSPIISQQDYYPFGLSFNCYQRENSVDQNNLYQGKELQEELDLNLYDFHARQYDPTIGRTTTMDPMAQMFPSLSSYSWAANNPMRFIDPTGMVIEDGSRKEWNKQRGRVEKRAEKLQGRIDKLNAKAEAKGWSAEKLAGKVGNLGERASSLKNSLSTMNDLENSAQVYSLKSGVQGEGGVTYDTKTGNVVIGFGSTANFVHETTHAGQFESGHMAFAADGSTLGQDVMDEVNAYKAQFAYDPSSVSGLPSSSVAQSFGGITATWVQNLTASDGSKIYGPGGSANTGLVPVDVTSGKAQMLKAYPRAAGYLRGKPAGYRLRDEPGIIMAPSEYNGY